MASSRQELPSTHAQLILDCLNEQRKTEEQCDIIFTYDTIRILAHKHVMGIFSPMVLKNYIIDCPTTRLVTLIDCYTSALQSIVDYMYTGVLTITDATLGQLHREAYNFGIKAVRDLCQQYANKNLSPTNCISVFVISTLCRDRPLYLRTLPILCANFSVASKQPEFYQLKQADLKYIISGDSLVVPEFEVVQAVIGWMKQKSPEEQHKAQSIWDSVRLYELTYPELESLRDSEIFQSVFPLYYKPLMYAMNIQLEAIGNDAVASYLAKPAAIQTHKKPVLAVFGGLNAGNFLANAESYNPVADSWTPFSSEAGLAEEFPRTDGDLESPNASGSNTITIANLPCGLTLFGMTVCGGYLYLLGGKCSSGTLKTSYLYDCFNKFWKPLPFMEYGRCSLGAATVKSIVYAIGGDTGNQAKSASAECFNHTHNIWSGIASMTYKRIGLCVTVVQDQIYAIGGENNEGPLASVEVFSPDDNTWTNIADMSRGRTGAAAAVLNDRIYVAGGKVENVQSTVEMYDPITDIWQMISSMQTPRRHMGMASYEGKLFVIGGSNEIAALSDTECFDPITDAWTVMVGSMSTGREGLTAITFPEYALFRRDNEI